MITKIKTSVTISSSLFSELTVYNRTGNVSEFIEQALDYYIAALKKKERAKRDLEIINANAGHFNRQAEENLLYQMPL
jgi:metal-responsive CopG/Arc/MetJ family transcriptional regulator